MFCPNCGIEISEGKDICPACKCEFQILVSTETDVPLGSESKEQYDVENQTKPDNAEQKLDVKSQTKPDNSERTSDSSKQSKPISTHLAWSIICTLCFFTPLGIAALVYSNKVKKLLCQGKYSEAKKASGTAVILNTIGTIIAAIIYIEFICISLFQLISMIYSEMLSKF